MVKVMGLAMGRRGLQVPARMEDTGTKGDSAYNDRRGVREVCLRER